MQPEQQPSYQDDEETSFAEATSSDRDNAPSFPQQLMEVLSNERLSDVVSWLPHGQGWIIHDKKRFAVEVLPVYFEKKSKWTSFTRKLNRWNFTRVTRGDEVGAYYHPLFKRENKDLCLQMNCLGSKMAQNLEPLNPVALGLATPKMIEHGLLSGMVPRRNVHSTKKKKAAMPSQPQTNIVPPSSSSSGTPSSSALFFPSQQRTDPTTTPLPPSSSASASLHLNPLLHTFTNTSIPSSTAQGTGCVDQQQPLFMGTIGNPLTSSTYSGIVLPELRNASPSPHVRRPPSPNPLLPAFVSATSFLQPNSIPSSSYSTSSSWTQHAAAEQQYSLFSHHPAPTPPFFASQQTPSNPQQQHDHQNMMAYFEGLNQRFHAASQDDTLTLTPTPALSHHSSVETPSGGLQPNNRGLLVEGLQQQPVGSSSSTTTGGQEEAWSPDDHSGHDISPSMFDTTSSSSDQAGSGVHHHDHYSGGRPPPPHGPPPESRTSSEEASKKMSPTTRLTNTTTPVVRTTPRALHEQHYQGMISDRGGEEGSADTFFRKNPVVPGSLVLSGGDQLTPPPGGVGSSSSPSMLSLTPQHAAVLRSSQASTSNPAMGLLESILGQTRKDIHDLLQQQQQQQQGRGAGGALTSPSTMQSIVRGNQKGAARTPPGEEQQQK